MEALENNICEVPSISVTAIGTKAHNLTTSDKKVICDECFKEFSEAKTLWSHKKTYHSSEPPMKCNICCKTFYLLYRLTEHIKGVHGLSGDRLEKCIQEYYHGTKWKITCHDPECRQRFRRMTDYHLHLYEVHGIIIETESRDFTSIEEYNHWLETIERCRNLHYVVQRGERSAMNNIKSKFLFCHRSGFQKNTRSGVAKINIDNVAKKAKKRRTCKMSGHCSSFIEVNQYPDDSVNVRYWKTHVGHGTSNKEDIMLLPIPQSEREHIAGLVLQGISRKDIVKSYSQKSAAGSRMSYLCGKDIGNVKTSFHLDTDEGLRMHQEHKQAIDLVAKVVQQGVFVFTVPSSIQMNKQYIVRKESECLDKKCASRCSLCQACTHSLTCECEMDENLTCKHVHAVNMWCKFQHQHRLFYEQEQEETEKAISSLVEERIPPSDEEFSTELENKGSEAKILLVELIGLIEECKDVNAVIQFIDLLNKTKTILTSNISKNGKYTERKRRLPDSNTKYSKYSKEVQNNPKKNKVNVTKSYIHIDKKIQPIKIKPKPKSISFPRSLEPQLINIKSAQGKRLTVKVSKQKSKKVMVYLDSTDSGNFVPEIVEPKVNLYNKDHKTQVLHSGMTRRHILVPSPAQFIENDNQLLSSVTGSENLITNACTENIQLPLKDYDKRISLPGTRIRFPGTGTRKEHVQKVNTIDTQDFPSNSVIQDNISESGTNIKLKTLVRGNDGQLKEFFFKICD